MAEITGFITAYYSYDVAETIRLSSLKATLGPAATLATIYDKAPGAPRVRYIQPPVIADGAALGQPTIDAFRVRIKFYDYGVVSLQLSQPFEGSWAAFVALGRELIENEALQRSADEACRQVVDRVRSHLEGMRTAFLDEDYLVFAVTGFAPAMSAEELLERHAADIAQLLRGERQTLSPQEREETLRHRLSYLVDDLVVPAWNAAFVYDTESAAMATLEILEFANSQLLEFRYHDERLETTLTRIYADLQHPRWTDRFIGKRYLRATRELHGLFIDVNELTDRTENALKLVGDLYAARLFNIVAARLGLDQWKRNVEDKMKTLDDIYRFAVEHTRVSQGNIMELVVVIILVIELALTLRGLF
jgi:hypothetical protein